MKKNMKQWVADSIQADKKKGCPVLSFPAIQLMGVTVKELISSSDLQAQGMKLVSERTDSGIAVSLMDLSVEAECFGSEIRISEDEVPTVIGRIISTEEETDALVIPEIGVCRTQMYIDAIEKAVGLIEERPVFAGVIGPFSLAGRLLGVTDAMVYCYDEPDMVHTVLEKVTTFLVRYCQAYKAVGANGVVLAEPLAGLLSPALAQEFSADYVRKLIDSVQDDHFIVVYHNCGNTTVQTVDSILSTGALAMHFGNAIRMSDILERIPPNIMVMGNIDPAGEFRNGTVESIKTSTKKVLEECCRYPNFIISSGCDIPPMSKWENIDAFFEAVKEFYL